MNFKKLDKRIYRNDQNISKVSFLLKDPKKKRKKKRPSKVTFRHDGAKKSSNNFSLSFLVIVVPRLCWQIFVVVVVLSVFFFFARLLRMAVRVKRNICHVFVPYDSEHVFTHFPTRINEWTDTRNKRNPFRISILFGGVWKFLFFHKYSERFNDRKYRL